MAQTAAKMVEPTDDAHAIYLMNHPHSDEEIPIIDMGPYLAGETRADKQLAAELRDVTETVGFFYLKNHPVPQQLIDRMFVEAKRFFALPLEEKRKIPRVANTGYVEVKEPPRHKGNEHLIKTVQPALNESFIIARERTPDDPDVIAGKLFASLNTWPANLPGFRETLLEYHSTLEALGKRFLPVWALSLGLPKDFFEPYFTLPHCNLRLLHYPPPARSRPGAVRHQSAHRQLPDDIPGSGQCAWACGANAVGSLENGGDHSGHAPGQYRQPDAAVDQRTLQIHQACGHQYRWRGPLFVPRVLWAEL